LNINNVGETIRLSGWVHRVRDHGGLLFIDLRDHYGMTQVLCDPDSPVFKEVEKLRSEWCIRIDGTGESPRRGIGEPENSYRRDRGLHP
jgi:aspartyl-tRNA synthetase